MFIFLIKEVREEKGITQKELAEMTGLSRNYIAELENNKKKNASFETILKIAEALNVDIRKIYVAVSDIEMLRKEMHRRMDEYGINSPEVLEVSQIIDKLVVLKMEEKGFDKI